MVRIVAALLLVVATIVSASAQSLPIPSVWMNMSSSQMNLYTMDAQGNLTGTYTNYAGDYNCKNPPFNPPYKLTGHVNGAQINFTVVWNNGVQNCNSQTVWRGHISNKTIGATWTLTGKGVPPSFGFDFFTPSPY